jgi:LmbE family N-acetylglucosaminyl deacetylase
MVLHHKGTKSTKLFFFALFVSLWLHAQPRGAAELSQLIARLGVTGSLLHTAAHPDDEHSTMLAYMARGRHVRTAYLSLTRGDGGQNLLGTEQGEAIGLLRTQELLDARRLDGADQFFTRALDFGFSKTAAETLEKWGKEAILSDVVRILRTYRPDVIVSRFSGTSSDGHGNHQAAGLLTLEAFRAAADPNRSPEQIREGLRPWQPKKLYLTVNRFGPQSSQPFPAEAVVLDFGAYDPVLGASYDQIGAEGRAFHRSQGFAGFPIRLGASRNGFILKESALPKASGEQDLFDGINITLDRLTESGAAAGDVAALKDLVAEVQSKLRPERPHEIAPLLGRGLGLVRKMAPAAGPELRFLLQHKERDFTRALELSHAQVIEALAERGEWIPGRSYRITVSVWNRSAAAFAVQDISLTAPAGWKVEAGEWKPGEVSYNRNSSRAFMVTPPPDAKPSQPYWLERERTGDVFAVADPKLIGLPESPPLMEANVAWTIPGLQAPVSSRQPVLFRHTDPIYGQRDQRVQLLPAVAAWTEPQVLIFPDGAREIKVRLRNNTPGPEQGKFSLTAPAGWKITPAEQTFEIKRPGEETTCVFQAAPLSRESMPAAVTPSAPYSTGYQVISYPHIPPQYWFRPAATRLVPVDLKIAPDRKVGYIMGAGDDVPAALRQMGVEVTLLAPDDVLAGNFARYHAVVVGIRGYSTRPDLVAANDRLLEYVRNGGILIVQYQGQAFQGDSRFAYGPYLLDMGRPSPRVSVEEAPVEMLAPEHPLLATPNRIGPADFAGWVQERGLYFMRSWAPEYTPLLSCGDPGEPPQKGGMLAARFGKGLYVFTAYAWFRQLPAGVPGAYRIWANMLSWQP